MIRKRRMPVRVNKNTYATQIDDNITRVECIYGDAAETAFDVLVGQIFMCDFTDQDNNEAFYSYCAEENSLLISENKKQLGFTMRFSTIKYGLEYHNVFRNTLSELFDVMYCLSVMHTLENGIEGFNPKEMFPEIGPFAALFCVYTIRVTTEEKQYASYLCEESNKLLDYIRKNYDHEKMDDLIADYIQNVLCVKKKILDI